MTDPCKTLQVSWKVLSARLGSFIGVGLVVLFLEIYGEPTKRGFFCNDETIKYPFNGNTISEKALVVGAILIPLFFIFLTQLCTYGLRNGRKRICCLPMPQWFRTACETYGSYMIGLGLTLILLNIGKLTIGRLRPHFLAVCQPDVATCNGTTTGYVTVYNCSGAKDDVIEARLSFPSGHASVGFYTLLYLIVYIQLSPKWRKMGMLRICLQFIFMALAWWISLTRIMDNWHHWSDVLAGAILGCIATFLTVKYLPGIRPTTSEDQGNSFLPLKRARNSPQLELSEQS